MSKRVASSASFAAFILAHGRPDNCPTFDSLRRCGYTGRIVVLLDNEDKTRKEYEKAFGVENIQVFDKKDISARYPNADNFQDRRAVVYARNASFEVAKKLGIKYFVQLDDDYRRFLYRVDKNGDFFCGSTILNLDSVFGVLLRFLLKSDAHAVAFAQGGDYMGGSDNNYIENGWMLRRKTMNSWFCRTDRPFPFSGRMNEDVSAYVLHGSRGFRFFTLYQVMLDQAVTQAAEGGMTEVYKDGGTYKKSFYTVIQHPSSVRVALFGQTSRRLHHLIDWNKTVPRIVSESLRKV